MILELRGRAAIVTGGSQGLGLAIAKRYLAAGARVAICGRDASALDIARDELESLGSGVGFVRSVVADVSVADDVDALVAGVIDEFGKVDILVNNAGVYGPFGEIEKVDWGEWVRAIEINLMGSVLPARALLPHFKSNGYGKIVQLSGGGATNPLPRISAYAASKAAIVRFVETLAEEVRGESIDVNAIAPGALNTRLLDEVLDAGPDQVGDSFYQRALKQKESGGARLERGADLALFLASSASDGITGKLISAVWDPWAEFPEHFTDLKDTDVYTLRRIVPKDRGLGWGDE